MMTCNDALAAMLECDPREVEPGAGSPLAEHLRECAACQMKATAVLEHHATLVRAYQSAGDLGPCAHAAVPRRRLTMLVPWMATAIAAAVVLVVGMTRRVHRAAAVPAAVERDATAPPAPSLAVEVPPGKNAIIMNTKDPTISVVWIY